MVNGSGVEGVGDKGVGRAKPMKGAGDRAGSRTREVRSIRMDAQDHVGSPIDLATIRMLGNKPKQASEARQSRESGGRLLGSESTRGLEDAGVHAPPIVKEVAYCHLKLLHLGGRGRGGEVRAGGGLGGFGSVGGGGIDGGRSGGGNTVGTKTGEEGGDVARVGEGERTRGAVVVDGKSQKFGGDGVSFAVVGEREDGDKVGEVVLVVVLDTKVIHHQDEGDGARDMAEEAGGGGFEEAVGGEVGDEAELGELTRLL